MRDRYLTIGKLMILLLALGTPAILYQGYRNQRELTLKEAELKLTATEDDTLVRGVCHGFFSDKDLLEDVKYQRSLPMGPISGFTPFPSIEIFREVTGIEIAQTGNGPSDFLGLLWAPERFFSGLPKRYAGLVELLAQQRLVLEERDMRRLYEVAADFREGSGLNEPDHLFLLSKIRDPVSNLFNETSYFLGGSVPKDANHLFYANLQVDGTRYFFSFPDRKRIELNRVLDAFDIETMLQASDEWLDWGDLRLTLKPEAAAPGKPLRRTALRYFGIGLAVELLLFLLYGILVKYRKIHHAQKQLLAATSHELRTPLAVMRQFSEMLVDRGDRFPEKYRSYHGHILRECLKMQFLVENLLSAARFETLSFEPDPAEIHLAEWMKQMVDSVGRLSDQEIELSCPDLTVFWDVSLMGQVLANLLENARIHARTSVRIAVEDKGELVLIEVRDYGSGPGPGELKKIEAFKTKSSRSGLGLGLYLCHRIVSAHGGRLAFESAKPGLRVVVTMLKRAGSEG